MSKKVSTSAFLHVSITSCIHEATSFGATALKSEGRYGAGKDLNVKLLFKSVGKKLKLASTILWRRCCQT